MCKDPGCRTPDVPQAPAFFGGGSYTARQYWIGAGNLRAIFVMYDYSSGGHLACTLERLNKRPVAHFLFDDSAGAGDCRGSLSNPGQPHRVPNFRSDHPSGGNFLFADGSVHFIAEDVDMDLYRALSTVAGGPPAGHLTD